MSNVRLIRLSPDKLAFFNIFVSSKMGDMLKPSIVSRRSNLVRALRRRLASVTSASLLLKKQFSTTQLVPSSWSSSRRRTSHP